MPWTTLEKLNRRFSPITLESPCLTRFMETFQAKVPGFSDEEFLRRLRMTGFEKACFIGQLRLVADASLQLVKHDNRNALIGYLTENSDDFTLAVAALAVEDIYRNAAKEKALGLFRIRQYGEPLSSQVVGLVLEFWRYECGSSGWSCLIADSDSWNAALAKMCQEGERFDTTGKKEGNLLDNPRYGL